jgi:hypothetical protein
MTYLILFILCRSDRILESFIRLRSDYWCFILIIHVFGYIFIAFYWIMGEIFLLFKGLIMVFINLVSYIIGFLVLIMISPPEIFYNLSGEWCKVTMRF